MKPDISLMFNNKAKFILDTKWKRINKDDSDRKHGIIQADMYQLFAYGKKYGCKQVALVYPKTKQFQDMDKLRYRFDEELSLACFPFDVTEPERECSWNNRLPVFSGADKKRCGGRLKSTGRRYAQEDGIFMNARRCPSFDFEFATTAEIVKVHLFADRITNDWIPD